MIIYVFHVLLVFRQTKQITSRTGYAYNNQQHTSTPSSTSSSSSSATTTVQKCTHSGSASLKTHPHRYSAHRYTHTHTIHTQSATVSERLGRVVRNGSVLPARSHVRCLLSLPVRPSGAQSIILPVRAGKSQKAIIYIHPCVPAYLC